MATETTTVQGKVVTPTGAVATAGTLTITLSTPGQITDGTNVNAIGGTITTSIAATGDVSFALVPNDTLSPSGTFYRVVYQVTAPVRAKWTEDWNVLVGTDPIDIGDIERVQTFPTVIQPVASSAAAPSISALPTASVSYLGLTYILDTGSGETASYMCHRTAAGTYEWVYSGGAPTVATTVTALPAASSYGVGARLFLDTGSGETSAYMCHRNSADVNEWAQVSTGGS